MSTSFEKAQQFMAKCPGTSRMQADRYLGDTNGDVDAAVDAFNQNMKNSNQRSTGTFNANTSNQVGGGPRSGNMATLAAQQKGKSNEYFVGGGDNSGQAVVAPKVEGRPNDPQGSDEGYTAENIFNAARNSGANELSDFDESNKTVAFSGAGRRLGYTEGPSPVMAPVVPNQRKVKITFYKDGFVIDDSNELRSLTDEAGKAFVGSIMKGYIPQELSTKYPNTTIDVKLVDQSKSEFEPSNLFVAFAGAGHKLSATGASSATAIGGTTTANPGHTVPAPTTFEYNEAEEPKGKVVIQTPDGRRCEHKVNPARHTVNDLRFLASQDVPGLLMHRIDLVVRDMPPRKLTDFSQTLAEAKCVNAVIMIRPFS